jgi:hypothetical protein
MINAATFTILGLPVIRRCVVLPMFASVFAVCFKAALFRAVFVSGWLAADGAFIHHKSPSKSDKSAMITK